MTDPTLHELISSETIIPILALGMGGLIAIVAIISCTIRTVAVGRAKEQTKRELAAYVAEGTLDADKAVAMINAGRPVWEVGKGTAKAVCCES